MRKGFMQLCIMVAVFLVVFSGRPHEADGAAKEVRLVIQTDRVKGLHRELYGFNTNMLNGIWTYTDPAVVDLVSSLKPKVLRFPGGTVGNFYHWRKAGFNQRELESSSIKWLSNQHENLLSRQNGVLSFDDFMALCNKFDIKPILTVNLYTGTPEESAAWVRYVKEKGYRVFGWELGNELNFPMYRNKFRGVEDYIETAKKHARAMKAVDPAIRLGVVTNAGFFKLLKPERAKRSIAWNKRLSEEGFFDAYVAHLYIDKDFFSRESAEDMEQTKSDLFEITDALLETATKGFEGIYKGREMWVTEWNIQFWNENRYFADTLLHALYCGDFFINMAKEDAITNADYHVLSAPWNGYPLMSPAGKDSDSAVKRACYYSFDLLKDAMSLSDRKFLVNIENNPRLKESNRYTGKPVRGVSAVSIGTDKRAFVLVSNRTSGDIAAEVVLNGKRYNGKLKYRYLTAKELSSTGRDKQIEVRTNTCKAADLVLPSNSFGLLELLDYRNP